MAAVFAWNWRGLPVDILGIDGNVSGEQARRLARAIWEHMPELRPEHASQFGNYQAGQQAKHSPPLALTQLLITHYACNYTGDSHFFQRC